MVHSPAAVLSIPYQKISHGLIVYLIFCGTIPVRFWVLHAPHMRQPLMLFVGDSFFAIPPWPMARAFCHEWPPQVTSFNHACKVISLRTRVYVLSRFQFNSPCMNGTEEVGIEYQEFRLWTGTQRAGKRHHNKLIFASWFDDNRALVKLLGRRVDI